MKKGNKNKGKNKGNSLPSVYPEEYYYDAVSDDLVSVDSNDGDYSFDCDEYQVHRLPLTLDLSAVTSFPAKQKKSPTKMRTKSTCIDNAESTSAGLLDCLLLNEPRLVRSKSSTLVRGQLLKHERRRSAHALSDANPNPLHQLAARSLASVRCIQSLISARPSVIGPTPRASLPILSDTCQSAVLIVWFPLRIIPLVNCSPSLASELQARIEREVPHENIESRHDWLSYWRLTTFLVERCHLWSHYLDTMAVGDLESSAWDFFTLGCRKAGMALGRSHSHYDVLKGYLETRQSPFSAAMVGGDRTCEVHDGTACLICLDELSDSCQLLPCGHAACMACYKAYLTSAANSGEGSIKCAAHNCNVEIDMFDAAHILYDDPDVFQRLVRFALERSAHECRFCSAPHCGKLMKPYWKNVSKQSGYNITVCDCGTSLCNDCKTGGPAHPGVSCQDFSKLRNTMNAVDAEIENIKWVMSHSRPCPKCRYPIQKIEGCNHVRCQQCQCYFCFECGGEGHLCFAYECKKVRSDERYWHDDAAFNGERYTHLTTLARRCRAYRFTNENLATMIQEVGKGKIPTNTSQWLEIPCTLLLSWMHLQFLSRMTESVAEDIDRKTTLQLELILHAMILRDNKDQARHMPNHVALFGVLELAQHVKSRHCKEASKNRECGKKENRDFESIFVDQELSDLLMMSDSRFVRVATDAIRRGIQTFAEKAPSNIRRRWKADELETQLLAPAPLNQKKSRSNAPWRNARRHNNITEERFDWSDDDTGSKKRYGRWKASRTRVSTRRAVALDSNDL